MDNITLKKINSSKNSSSDFIKIYYNLLSNKKELLTKKDLQFLLRNALLFLNQKDLETKKFGYSIILHYSLLYNDYIPLYEISLNLGFIPITHFIEKNIFSEKDGFFNVWLSSFQNKYQKNGIYLTFEQKKLEEFVSKTEADNFLIVAPTSYGKSELMISSMATNLSKVCIIVPTKALLAQTKSRILKKQMSEQKYIKIITHPDMYNNDEAFVAILTQERLLTLMQKYPQFYIDTLMVDEAHNLLESTPRNILLAQVILIALKRNNSMKIEYFTPFIENADSLKSRYFNQRLDTKKISEFIKIERFYLFDKYCLENYDQFTNTFYNKITINKNDFEFINYVKGRKNIIYANKPKDVEHITKQLCAKNIENFISSTKEYNAIKTFLHAEYNLLDGLKKGIVYHHGGMPDNIKLYVEYMYRKYNELLYIVTTSTLLEGVNIPAEKIFILSSKKGRRNLTRSNFINLVGRVCRFNDIFNNVNKNLNLLEPEVYLINGQYMASNFNPKLFLETRLGYNKLNKDLIENPLLMSKNDEEELKAIEYIENVEKGTVSLNKKINYASSKIAISCFNNNIQEFDIIENEKILLQNYEYIRNIKPIKTSNELLDLIYFLFIQNIQEIKDDNIKRLSNASARSFYQMFLNWRVRGVTYKTLIEYFIEYWNELDEDSTIIYVGPHWGEIKLHDTDRIPLYVNIKNKDYKQRINLAIVKIKEEQDFLDFYIMKFVEVINDLGLIDSDFYQSIKYGSSDKRIILMLQNGFSLDLALLLKNKVYLKYIKFDFEKSEVIFDECLINELKRNQENDILIFEAQFYIFHMK